MKKLVLVVALCLRGCNPSGHHPEVIVTEQWLDEGGFDVRPPTILSYWPDLSKDDGTLSAAILRCENQGGEMVAEYIEGDWVRKCEAIDY